MKLCSIVGCNNNHLAKEFCNKHYLRNKTYGDPLHVVVRICSVAGCNKKHKGRGYCVNHLIHYRNYGDPLVYADPEETARKKSASLKGKTPWNKGKTGVFSEKTRRGWSEKRKGQTSSMKGKKHSEASKKKMSEAGKGRIVSEATKKKMSERIISAETRKKLSERIISAETRKKISLAHKGRKYPNRIVSQETRKKISDFNSTPERKAQQREIRSKQKFPSKDSKPELLVQSILGKNNVTFLKHKNFKLNNSNHQADIVIEPDKVIELFGDYWHFNPKIYDGESVQKMRRKQIKVKEVWKYDKYLIDGMKQQGYKVLVVWESELKNELESTTKKILKFVKI